MVVVFIVYDAQAFLVLWVKPFSPKGAYSIFSKMQKFTWPILEFEIFSS